MAFIKIKAGFNIPMIAEPKGDVMRFSSPSRIALDLSSFDDIKLKLLVKIGEVVKEGQPLCHDKELLSRQFVAPTSGTVIDIVRGEKRRLLFVVIEPDGKNEQVSINSINLDRVSKQEIIDQLLLCGAFSYIRKRPCHVLAHPDHLPRSIFVQGIESAPYRPQPEMHIEGFEDEFQQGLKTLEKLVCGNVHVVSGPNSHLADYCDGVSIHAHTAIGPHPIANPSIHIEHIDPISSLGDVIWTLHIRDVVKIGALMMGRFHHEKVIGIGGEGILPDQRSFLSVKEGQLLQSLLENRSVEGGFTLISGDPLMGSERSEEEFLGFNDLSICRLPNSEKREWFHFFRLGIKKFTATHTYLSRYFQKVGKQFSLNSLVHGEKRPFVDGAIYDRVMPLTIPTMPFVKALLEKDYEKACELGLLEVAPEDFALSSFICPSKIDHIGIVDRGLKEYANQYL